MTMPVKYFAPKVNVKLYIIDFSPRNNRGQNNEVTIWMFAPPTSIYTPVLGWSVPDLMQVFPENVPWVLTLISTFINSKYEMYTDIWTCIVLV